MFARRNDANGTFARIPGKGQIPLFTDRSPVYLGPRATVVISGVTDIDCCASGATIRVNPYGTNRSHCLELDTTLSGALSGIASSLRWSENHMAPSVELSTALRCSDSSSFVMDTDTVLCYCRGVWTVYRWVASTGTGLNGLIFYGTKVDDGCWPLVIPNALTVCGSIANPYTACTAPWENEGPGTYPFMEIYGAGGSATVEFACCGTDTDAGHVQLTATNINKIRTCCEVINVTLSGGTSADGSYRLTKGSTGVTLDLRGTGAWLCPVNTAGRVCQLYQRSTNWELVVSSTAGSCTFTQPFSTCPKASPWILIANSAGGSPVLDVKLSQCWG